MTNNKWIFILCLFLGLDVAGQAIYYFVSGESSNSSSLRDFLVVVQFLFGIAVGFYGLKKFSTLNYTKN